MKTIGFIALSFLSVSLSAQRVMSSAYDLLLDGLLSHTVNELSVAELQEMSDIQLLDSRELEEFQVSHLQNAIFVGYTDFSINALDTLNKDKPVVVYCSIGYRSEKIAEKLEASGFTKVYNLYGGIFEWVNQGHKVYNTIGATANIHPYSWIWGQWLSEGTKTTKP